MHACQFHSQTFCPSLPIPTSPALAQATTLLPCHSPLDDDTPMGHALEALALKHATCSHPPAIPLPKSPCISKHLVHSFSKHTQILINTSSPASMLASFPPLLHFQTRSLPLCPLHAGSHTASFPTHTLKLVQFISCGHLLGPSPGSHPYAQTLMFPPAHPFADHGPQDSATIQRIDYVRRVCTYIDNLQEDESKQLTVVQV